MICIGLQLFAESPVYNNTEIGPIRIGSCNDFSGLGGCGAYSTMDVVVISLDAIDNFIHTSPNTR